MQTAPPAVVDAVVAAPGRQGPRRLPARVVVYYILAWALHSEASYEEVMRYVADGVAWEAQG